ncbi:alpha-glucosidase/alpha-galactosidase [Paraburkholderia sp. MMS20-SJTN17]|uniref:Alpha-glucosidase/alpha-galactosidase n=1 Tax=Paraburkholderia translucens TaxID=2886945 RepID=A0ABS8KCT2_9BURK|nr:alpha-glucosidase/alpha-galactosidase [Paraburkholderia sp. MMS20-SJTN17]MCC8402293.1 alpha-glucosidase/alpha-galactosidase [Paraburkholderia sp. MMS20-SJTN17]
MKSRPKIALIGAGSIVFARNLLGDILSYPELADCEIALHDIDEHRLRLAEKVAHRIAGVLNVKPAITATTDRRKALDGARFAINMIQVGGYRPATVTDFEIPKKFGLEQTIGDTLGIGGIMRALRTIPVQLDMLRDMEELCADGAVHLNYVNPMAMITWALNRVATRVPTVGLCHSVQHTASELADDLGIPVEEIDYHCAGINHMAFYLKFERNGEDLIPRLKEIQRQQRMPDWNRVRYEMLAQLGYFPTESSEHFSEYVPWFIKTGREELLKKYNIPLDEYPGRCQIFEHAWPYIERELENPGSQDSSALIAELAAADIRVMQHQRESAARLLDGLHTVKRSVEYGSSIIHSIVTGTPRVVYGNVLNHHLIDNLPHGCAVEVPCLVDANGVQPTRIGALPPQLAALMRSNVNVQELVVEAVLTQNREHVYHAAMMDPHTAAVLDLEQIRAMVDELLRAHADYLPAYLHA